MLPRRIGQSIQTMGLCDSREKRLARDVVQHDRLPLARQIGIDPIFAQKLVVLDMIPLERHGIRHADRNVGDHRQQLVRQDPLEREVVCDFVDCQKDVLVGGAADDVRRQEELPREGIGIAEEVRRAELNRKDEQDARRSPPCVTHQLAYLRVRLEDRLSS